MTDARKLSRLKYLAAFGECEMQALVPSDDKGAVREMLNDFTTSISRKNLQRLTNG